MFQRNDNFNGWLPNYGVWKCDMLTNEEVEQNFNDFIDEIVAHSSFQRNALTRRSFYPRATLLKRPDFYAETTSGSENDCLIHSVLTICSPSFRLQNDTVKTNVASFFRRRILTQMPGFTLQEIDLLKSVRFLDDQILTKIARCFKLGFCVFLTGDDKVQLINNLEGYDYYLISNNGSSKQYGTHFEAVSKIIDNKRIYKISFEEGNELGAQAYGT